MQIIIPLEQLIFTQQEVEEEGINDYIKKIQSGESFDPIYGRYCHHNNRYYVLDGHHKSFVLFFHFGIKNISLVYDDCSKPDTHKLSLDDPCVIKEDFYVFSGTIHDLRVVNYNLKED
jgi:hypothetical protein